MAYNYRRFIQKHPVNKSYEVQDKAWLTWFPAFRANYEVAQVSEGAHPISVFFSSVRVKFYASLGAAMYTFILPLIVDINELSNEEGFFTMFTVDSITFAVGLYKLKSSNMDAGA